MGLQVLETDATNVKALFRRAQAWMGSQDYLEAEQDIKQALERDPSNRDVRALHKRCRMEQAVQNRKEAKLYSNLFSKLAKLPDLEPQVCAAQTSMAWSSHSAQMCLVVLYMREIGTRKAGTLVSLDGTACSCPEQSADNWPSLLDSMTVTVHESSATCFGFIGGWGRRVLVWICLALRPTRSVVQSYQARSPSHARSWLSREWESGIVLPLKRIGHSASSDF